jgi:hypothetical protein
MRTVSIVVASTLVALALPGLAAAQSAGDEQYADPLAGDNAPSQDTDRGAAQQQQQQQQPVQTPPSADPAPQATGTQPPAEPAGDSGRGSLPVTGLPAVVLAAAGGLLLLGGAATRRAASAPVRRWTARGPLVMGRDVRLRRRR